MDNEEIIYRVSYRAVKYPRIELSSTIPLIILPKGMKPELVISRYKEWLKRRLNHINKLLTEPPNLILYNRSDEDFISLVYSYIENMSKELNVKVSKVKFTKMKTKWGSMNSKQRLSLNLLMKYIPEYHIKYIVYHELCHILVNCHNKKFYQLVSLKFMDYKRIKKELNDYWYLILNEETK